MRVILSIYIVLRLLIGPPVDVLVDSQHSLPEWYAPGENTEARRALDAMASAAEAEGLRLAIFSGYRDFAHQARTYKRESEIWQDRVDEFIARPGHSEHQLGTAFDVAWPGLRVESLDSRNLRLFQWIQSSAHEYGFVVSYPLKTYDRWPYTNRWMVYKGDFIYEPWHIRYVGMEMASEIFSAGYLNPESTVLPQDFYQPWP